MATEPLRGRRELRVEDDHRAAKWVRLVAWLMDSTYRDEKNQTKTAKLAIHNHRCPHQTSQILPD